MHAWVLQHFSSHREDHIGKQLCRSSQIKTIKNSVKSLKTVAAGGSGEEIREVAPALVRGTII
jgi:hypothetical protein